MVIPATYGAAMLLAVVTLVCWGTWINTIKTTGKWRFELFCYDFSIGALVVSVIAAFTLGTMGSDITFSDNLTIVRRMQIAYALLAGAVFNLGHMLLMAGTAVAGIATAFPIALALALAIGMGWDYYAQPKGSAAVLLMGGVVMVIAIVIINLAYSRAQRSRAKELEHAALVMGKRMPVSKKTATKGVVISLVSGLFMGGFFPLVETARAGDLEMGPYPIGLLLTCGIAASTLLYNLYFLNLPVQGEAISMLAYFRGTRRQHLAGMAGGAIWAMGAIASLATFATPAGAKTLPVVSYGIGQGAAVLGMGCGLLVWKEFGAIPKVRILMWTALCVLLIGIALMVAAPLIGA
jgi:glucose uptake protein